MAKNLSLNDTVYVPRCCVSGLEGAGVALCKRSVLELDGKKVRVQLHNGDASEWVGSSLVHKEVGILVVNIGDFETEDILLDPLAKSVAQFCRLLVPDDQIRSIRVRSLDELKQFWVKEQAAYSHVIWVGHGLFCRSPRKGIFQRLWSQNGLNVSEMHIVSSSSVKNTELSSLSELK